MCGRFTLILEPDEIQTELDLGSMPPDLTPRYNVAPSQPVAVVIDANQRAVELFRWGLIPSWAKDATIGNRLINARAETLVEKPSFRNAFARRRCLVLADGFYEWDHSQGKTRGRATPYRFELADHRPFAFAGLWEFWKSPEGEPIRSCTLITCAANQLVGQYHDRMPVILDKAHLWDWLTETSLLALQGMLLPYPETAMRAYPVSALVNNPAIDTPDCIRPSE